MVKMIKKIYDKNLIEKVIDIHMRVGK